MAAPSGRHIAGAVICGAVLLSGCTTVRSTQLQNYAMGKEAAGLTYFLPSRMIKVTATRTFLTEEGVRKALAKQQPALAEAKAALAIATAARVQAEAELAALGADALAETRVQAQSALDLARAREAIATKPAQDLDAAVNALLDAQIAGRSCTYAAKLELLPPQADPANRFVARPVHSPLRDDTTILKVTPAGLLSSTNVVAVDRTGDIIVEVAGAIAGFGGAGGVRASIQSAEPDCANLPKQFMMIADPVEPGQIVALNAALGKAEFPLRIRVDAPTGKVPIPQQLAAIRGGAIFYRSPVPVPIVVEQCREGVAARCALWDPVDAALVALPQAGPTSHIPMNSSAFVKTVNDVAFTDGSIASWTADRPSEVLEIVRLPIRILTALISVPAQILSLRVDYSSKEEAFALAQRKEIERDARNRELMACITRAEEEGSPASACLQ